MHWFYSHGLLTGGPVTEYRILVTFFDKNGEEIGTSDFTVVAEPNALDRLGSAGIEHVYQGNVLRTFELREVRAESDETPQQVINK